MIGVEKVSLKIFNAFGTRSFLLTAGSFAEKKYNCMVIAWGSLGVMWGKPFAQVVVRPTRYTLEFLRDYESFTLCALPKKYAPALKICGTKSGRDTDKIKESGLTPVAASMVEAPAFAEAELVLECKKIYWDRFKPENFWAPFIEGNYQAKDYHYVFFGAVLAVRGTADYIAR